MAPSAPTTVAAAWAGPFNAETPFGTVEPGDVIEEVPYEQACGGHWVDPQTGEPFEPIAVSEPVEATHTVEEPAPGEGVPADTGPQGETHTAGADIGEEPI